MENLLFFTQGITTNFMQNSRNKTQTDNETNYSKIAVTSETKNEACIFKIG